MSAVRAADGRAPRPGRARHPAPAREAQRALDRAADRARRGVRLALRRRRRRLHRPHRRRQRLLLGDGHEPVRRRPRATASAWSQTSTVAFQAVGDCRRPVVAAVNGPALAGGFALSLLCDLRVASTAARFGYPELPRGIPPSYAAARAVLPATVAKELCLTGPDRRGGRGPAARDRARGRRGRRGRARAGARRADRRAAARRRSSRPSAARCSSASHLWGFLFDEEERVFRRALLGETEPAKA